MACDLDWVILRPSVVLGPGAYGASALFRGLAALPWLPVMPNTGLLQVVRLEDVVRTVEMFVNPNAPSRLTLEVAGPEALSFKDVVGTYRRWFGWPAARVVNMPTPLANLTYKLSDIAGGSGLATADPQHRAERDRARRRRRQQGMGRENRDRTGGARRRAGENAGFSPGALVR
ncbi:hypothetical protein Q1M63_15320 (plasmid) [Sinorhizobium meliloti]|nr:hypothetical protein Q1M63_15320 [Sinorhizobium meliloti]